MRKQDSFTQKKASILESIQNSSPDLSPKGDIDHLCWPIIQLINSHDDLVTTSSCSGRISIFAEGSKYKDPIATKAGGKGLGGRWLFVSHEQSDVQNWIAKLKKEDAIHELPDYSTFEPRESTRYILYKFEPFILHVKCRDFAIASRLYTVAMSRGFRESGIGSNFIVAIRINIKLELPIGFVNDDDGKLYYLVSQEFIRNLDNITYNKFRENSTKMADLYNSIEEELFQKQTINSSQNLETKEERKLRKIKEGMERQRLLRQTNHQSSEHTNS